MALPFWGDDMALSNGNNSHIGNEHLGNLNANLERIIFYAHFKVKIRKAFLLTDQDVTFTPTDHLKFSFYDEEYVQDVGTRQDVIVPEFDLLGDMFNAEPIDLRIPDGTILMPHHALFMRVREVGRANLRNAFFSINYNVVGSRAL